MKKETMGAWGDTENDVILQKITLEMQTALLFAFRFSSHQCSQPSGAPVGPGGGTAKSPGRDWTAKRSPSSSYIPTCRVT